MYYTVLVDDNFHYMDESERYCAGKFNSYEEALLKAKNVVDDYLIDAYQQGMSANELLSQFLLFGEDPFISSDDPNIPLFSSRSYAEIRCKEIAEVNLR